MIGSDRLGAIFGADAPSSQTMTPKMLAHFIERMFASAGRIAKPLRVAKPPQGFGAPTMIRTWDLPLRRRTLYPAELPGLLLESIC